MAICLSNNQDNFQLPGFATSENTALGEGATFSTHTVGFTSHSTGHAIGHFGD